ncbi:MAG TPA: sigma-54 dependent transcriptional regulator [Longimicrobiales bacterium]|nr:sigma-54 dependent transcriptional regulator [Longimicrobiales bacterium]
MASILIVDDEEGIRAFMADALAADGHETAQAGDAMEALKLLHERGFDVMLTDLRMPGALDGMDLVRQVRAEQPEMEVIVLTAHGSVESAVEGMKLGALDYLQKPVSSPAQLRLLVARALEHRRLLALQDQSRREAHTLPPLTYGDPGMAPVVRALDKVAPTNATVLLLGESGTGKEVAARTLHRRSQRVDGPFVTVNCAAITDTLMESEIFGHEKGAFTGATTSRRGRVELADGGTLFLDEIGELKPGLQAKLLRVIQEQRFERVGGTRTIEVDVRWIAATNRDIDQMVRDGDFREDLYHRLAVFPVRLPPLRERRRDIMPLAETLLARISADLGRPPLRLDDEARQRIVEGAWPGNVRELANTLERAAILAEGNTIHGRDLAIAPAGAVRAGHGSRAPASDDAAAGATRAATESPTGPDTGPQTMADIEKDAIRRALEEVDGNRRRAAERLGIGERTLYDKIRKYGLD